MERCSHVEMRKNLEIVELYRKNGVDFVAVPVRNEAHKQELIEQANKVLEDAANNG